MIITIDGPTASGKSTVAQLLAKELNIYFLSTGMLYRALSYLLVTKFGYTEAMLDAPNLEDVAQCLNPKSFTYRYDLKLGARIIVDGKDITTELKTDAVDNYSSIISRHKKVREALVEFQRAFSKDQDIIVEGRDCGSVVFPHADYKFFLTASLDVRAARWQKSQIEKNGKNFSLDESKALIAERDRRDKERVISPLIVPEGGIVVDNSGLDVRQTIKAMLNHIQPGS